ncbi:MAG: nitrile hydratase subunit beta [Rhodospirillales bacterium]|jgi:hypothetical protein|nr:nitrile hydratase subunit beta [Rhodospirillales bacterium]
MRRHHDMGGLEAGPIERTEHAAAAWEKRVNAILKLLANREPPFMAVDELRRGIEDLGPGTTMRFNTTSVGRPRSPTG